MKRISTKYVGMGSTLPARWVAKAEGAESAFVLASKGDEGTAALLLCQQMKWTDRLITGPESEGGTREFFLLEEGEMMVHIFSNAKHTRLCVKAEDLEELIVRCGWTVLEGIKGWTDEGRAEITRLEKLEYVVGRFSDDGEAALEWWRSRRMYETPALTPDI